MIDIKLYQIPKSVLAKEPKPIIEIDFLEELEEQGFTRNFLEAPQTLSLIGKVTGLCAEKLGHASKTNYGVLSVFDKVDKLQKKDKKKKKKKK